MTWSLAVMDDGITNALQTRIGKVTVVEYDYYYQFPDTDDGIPNTHGDKVTLSALSVSAVYDLIDLKIESAITHDISESAIEIALRDVLSDEEFSIAAINMSFGGPSYPFAFADEISQLANRGILTVAAAGNDGSHTSREFPAYPALLSDVIAVGSHDGFGNPSDFSQNGPGVDILADGEDMPSLGLDGTSFAAPRVAATVTHVQAIVDGLTGTRLSVGQMIDALQIGGAGPRSSPDPADGVTRYFLHDHAGSLDYAWYKYGGTPTTALEYVASHADLIGAFGVNTDLGRLHFEHNGSVEERAISFDGLEYIASYRDLSAAFHTNAYAGASHYIRAGHHEGRAVTFDGLEYIASYGDLIGAFGANQDAGSTHYIGSGYGEGRRAMFDGLEYIASYGDLIGVFGPNQDAGSSHFIRSGFVEGRITTFDGLQYIASHGDLIVAFGANSEVGSIHYIGLGYGEGRPADTFGAAQYLANYADLRAAFGTDQDAATRHFVTHGFYEGRTDEPAGAAGFVEALDPAAGSADFLL